MSEAYKLATIRYGDVVRWQMDNRCQSGIVEGWRYAGQDRHTVVLTTGQQIALERVIERRRWRAEPIVFQAQELEIS